MLHRIVRVLVLSIVLAGVQGRAQNQDSSPTAAGAQVKPAPANDSQETSQERLASSLQDTIDAREDDAPPSRDLVRWNQYEGPYFTIRFGGGFLVDYSAFAQDEESKEQFVMHSDVRLRDFRFVLGGKLFPKIKRSITWSAGIMYDAPNHQWLIRQTGVMIAVPGLRGNLFIGRSKEGFSLNKVMTGYDGWTMERSTMNDATIPILADGIKWLGYSPKRKFLWNLGYFNDALSNGQSFSTYSSQVVGRFILLPILSDQENKVLHVGVNVRWGKPVDNQIRFKSRPESYLSPYFIDTGSFQSVSTCMVGYEGYYRTKRWLLGSEYWWVLVSSKVQHDPVFNGGDFVVSYLFNDASRVYNTVGGYFRDVDPKRSVFQGGPGAWELVIRYSHSDFNNKGLAGGTFDRMTPQVNWYLSENVRLELNYGFGRLDRFNLKGNTQFFQTRVQLQF